jgi:CBS domain-containing protein
MTTVRQLLDQKGRNIWSIHPDATVFDAIAKMAEKDIGSLVVMEGEELVGIITERHYARNVVLKGKTSPATPVRDIMERHVVIAQPEQSVDQCMAVMSEKRVRHLPVFEGKKPIGIVSIGDLVKTIIGDQKFMIVQLEHYISTVNGPLWTAEYDPERPRRSEALPPTSARRRCRLHGPTK